MLIVQPARLDDSPAARVESGERCLQAILLQVVARPRLEHSQRLARRVCEIVDRRKRAALAALALERQIVPRHARVHFHHFLGLDAEAMSDVGHMRLAE